MEWLNAPKDKRKEYEFFMDDYIDFVYSKTSQKEPHNEDYSVFWTFESMNKFIDDFENLAVVAKPIYKQYEGMIRNSK